MMLPLAILPLLFTLPGPAASQDATQEFTGSGEIHVLNSTDVWTATPADRVGCLNVNGQLTLDDCAVFTRLDDLPYTLSTAAGNCSFGNPAMPTNTDSVYGRNAHAWSCADEDFGTVEYYYTINGLNYPFICTGDVDCYYDMVGKVPTEDTAPMPVWQFFWGSEQFDVPPGHWRVLWLWVKVNGTGQGQE